MERTRDKWIQGTEKSGTKVEESMLSPGPAGCFSRDFMQPRGGFLLRNSLQEEVIKNTGTLINKMKVKKEKIIKQNISKKKKAKISKKYLDYKGRRKK